MERALPARDAQGSPFRNRSRSANSMDAAVEQPTRSLRSHSVTQFPLLRRLALRSNPEHISLRATGISSDETSANVGRKSKGMFRSLLERARRNLDAGMSLVIKAQSSLERWWKSVVASIRNA